MSYSLVFFVVGVGMAQINGLPSQQACEQEKAKMVAPLLMPDGTPLIGHQAFCVAVAGEATPARRDAMTALPTAASPLQGTR